MAYYFLFPESDTTLYSHPNRNKSNAGSDEILEIVKERGTRDNLLYPSRVLLKFKNEEIIDLIQNTIGSSNFNTINTKVNLQLVATEPNNLLSTLNLNVYAVSQSWDEGTGRYTNLPTSSNGASWQYRDNDINKTPWVSHLTSSTHASTLVSVFGGGVGPHYLQNSTISSSANILIINGVNFVLVDDSTSFTNTDSTYHVDIPSSGGAIQMAPVLRDAINNHALSSSANFNITASNISWFLAISSSTAGPSGNGIVVTTSSFGQNYISGAAPPVFREVYPGWNLSGGANTSSLTPIFNDGTSGSIKNTLGIEEGGGTWYTGSGFYATEQYLAGDSLDTNFDVKEIVQKWSGSLFSNSTYPNGVDNNGFIIKKPFVIENNISHSFGYLQYFSVDTHTIHPPKLAFRWDDSTFPDAYTSSIKNSGDLQVSLYRNKKEYNQNDEATFRIHVRDRYPTRAFSTTSNYLNMGYFSTSSFYSIRDAHTEQEIIPFDDYTKLSADANGMFCKIYMKGLQPERYYRILFKNINNDGTTIYDDSYYFKIVR